MADKLKPSAMIADTGHRQSLMITGKKKEVMFQSIIEKADEIIKQEKEELKALGEQDGNKNKNKFNADILIPNSILITNYKSQ